MLVPSPIKTAGSMAAFIRSCRFQIRIDAEGAMAALVKCPAELRQRFRSDAAASLGTGPVKSTELGRRS